MDANIAKAALSIGSVKGIEFGAGFKFAKMRGSVANDQMNSAGFISNNAGGILGGISTGEDITFRVVIKPTPSISKSQTSKTISGETKTFKIIGRHDVCIVPRIVPVIEAMVSLVIIDALQYQKLLLDCKLVLDEQREIIDKIDEDILHLLYKRKKITENISKIKLIERKSIFQVERENEIFSKLREKAQILDLSEKFVRNLWKEIITNSKIQQKKV